MANIETLEDILNELADRLDVYGCCKPASEGADSCEESSNFCCRVGFMMAYKDRIYKAIENERKLEKIGL